MTEEMIQRISAVVDTKLPLVSNLANVAAILKDIDDINWCGFYLVDGEDLYLGPFQGDIACTIIHKGKGVCGASFQRKETIVVPNVLEFPGHIACSSKSRSEIVVPIIVDNQVKAVIDIDSPSFDRFSADDKLSLEKIASLLGRLF